MRRTLGGARSGHAAPAVALTFDDGPDPVYTPQVLDVLARHGAVSTFFLVGSKAVQHHDLVQRMVAEGHGVGSHSWSHPVPYSTPSPALLADYRRGRRAVEATTGEVTSLFRPPRGEVDARGALVMRALGLDPWLWSVDPEDWRPGIAADDVVSGVGELADGDVVLLHDSIFGPESAQAANRSATVAALPRIITSARDRGLVFTILPAC